MLYPVDSHGHGNQTGPVGRNEHGQPGPGYYVQNINGHASLQAHDMVPVSAPPRSWMDEESAKLKTSINETFWLFRYCFGGVGCTALTSFYNAEEQCCCLRRVGGTADCCDYENGLCYDATKICCVVNAAAFPPYVGIKKGMPICALCNVRCGGNPAPPPHPASHMNAFPPIGHHGQQSRTVNHIDHSSGGRFCATCCSSHARPEAMAAWSHDWQPEEHGAEDSPSTTELLMHDTFLLYYCLCMGVGCSSPIVSCIHEDRKCCCFDVYGEIVKDCGCWSVAKFCCLVQDVHIWPFTQQEYTLPPCAVCGVKFGDATHDRRQDRQPGVAGGSPHQVMMH